VFYNNQIRLNSTPILSSKHHRYPGDQKVIFCKPKLRNNMGITLNVYICISSNNIPKDDAGPIASIRSLKVLSAGTHKRAFWPQLITIPVFAAQRTLIIVVLVWLLLNCYFITVVAKVNNF
jgi:hypothetical protein